MCASVCLKLNKLLLPGHYNIFNYKIWNHLTKSNPLWEIGWLSGSVPRLSSSLQAEWETSLISKVLWVRPSFSDPLPMSVTSTTSRCKLARKISHLGFKILESTLLTVTSLIDRRNLTIVFLLTLSFKIQRPKSSKTSLQVLFKKTLMYNWKESWLPYWTTTSMRRLPLGSSSGRDSSFSRPCFQITNFWPNPLPSSIL